MPQARIRINGVIGSREVPLTWPATTPVLFSNQNIGGELTYFWQIITAPEGSLTTLNNPNIETPQASPDSEGSWLVRLTVNLGLASEQIDEQVFWCVDVKTGLRRPAAGESLQVDTTNGWAPAQNRFNKLSSDLRGDSGLSVMVAGQIGIAQKKILKVNGVTTIKTGLPGQESLPTVLVAAATLQADMMGDLFIAGTDIGGNVPANGECMYVRKHGLVQGVAYGGGALAGDPVFAGDTSDPSWFTPGTVPRQIGVVCAVGAGQFDMMFDGHANLRSQLVPLSWGDAATSNVAGAVYFLDIGYGATASATSTGWTASAPGRMSRFQIRAAAADDSVVLTVYKNGAPTALTTTLAAAAVSGEDMDESHSFNYAKGDYIDVRGTNGGAITTGLTKVRALLSSSPV